MSTEPGPASMPVAIAGMQRPSPCRPRAPGYGPDLSLSLVLHGGALGIAIAAIAPCRGSRFRHPVVLDDERPALPAPSPAREAPPARSSAPGRVAFDHRVCGHLHRLCGHRHLAGSIAPDVHAAPPRQRVAAGVEGGHTAAGTGGASPAPAEPAGGRA